MDDKFSALSKFDSVDNVELNSVAGGFNKLAYQIGHGAGVAVNIISTLRGFKGGRTKYRPKH